MAAASFIDAELARAQAWADRAMSAEERDAGDRRFVATGAGLYPPIRAALHNYGERHALKLHDAADHLMSSQAFCFDFLAPFTDRPDALADLLQPLVDDVVTPIWLPGEQGFVAFEYISGPDYLNEGGGHPRQRGANCTSVDTAIGFVRGGRRELLLIEWKLGESYGGPLRNKPHPATPNGPVDSNDQRRRRYASRYAEGVIAPDLPLDAFFYEPFYQLLRQQMLAQAIEADPLSGFDRVTLAHVSPVANGALKKVTAPDLRRFYPAGEAACSGWGRLLAQPDRYRPIGAEALFAAFPVERHPGLADWRVYMLDRYSFLSEAA